MSSKESAFRIHCISKKTSGFNLKEKFSNDVSNKYLRFPPNCPFEVTLTLHSCFVEFCKVRIFSTEVNFKCQFGNEKGKLNLFIKRIFS